MGKNNNNILIIFFYLVIIFSFVYLIYNSCNNKIIEGLENPLDDIGKDLGKGLGDLGKDALNLTGQGISAAGKGISNIGKDKTKTSSNNTTNGNTTNSNTTNSNTTNSNIIGQNFSDFNLIMDQARSPGDMLWKNSSLSSSRISGSNINKSLNSIQDIIDISGNLNNALEFINNEKELLRLMGISEMASNWKTLNPEFIKFYKDKMYFLNDIGQYVTTLCKKNPNNPCSILTPAWEKNASNWWGGATNNVSQGWNSITQNVKDDFS